MKNSIKYLSYIFSIAILCFACNIDYCYKVDLFQFKISKEGTYNFADTIEHYTYYYNDNCIQGKILNYRQFLHQKDSSTIIFKDREFDSATRKYTLNYNYIETEFMSNSAIKPFWNNEGEVKTIDDKVCKEVLLLFPRANGINDTVKTLIDYSYFKKSKLDTGLIMPDYVLESTSFLMNDFDSTFLYYVVEKEKSCTEFIELIEEVATYKKTHN